MCERLFGDAFVTTDNYTAAYTMWFFDGENPNDAVTEFLHPTGNTSVCDLNGPVTGHKVAPSPEGDMFTECHPWKSNSCCTSITADAIFLLNAYGPEYRWDRCGPLSPACERFFVQEACFYECSPHIGLYRRYGGHACKADDIGCTQEFNATLHQDLHWEVYRMPIRRDYCDAWYTACLNDMFCSNDGGNYFSCATSPPTIAPTTVTPTNTTVKFETEDEKEEVLSNGALAGIAILAFVVVGLAAFATWMCCQERAGKPMFAPLEEQQQERKGAQIGSSVSHTAKPQTQAV